MNIIIQVVIYCCVAFLIVSGTRELKDHMDGLELVVEIECKKPHAISY